MIKDTICVIETNIDDMSPVVYESLFEKLYNAGALEVFMTSVYMKKMRPGVLLSVLSPKDKLNSMAELILRETTSFGIRYYETRRLKLRRKKKTVGGGKLGKIRVTEGYLGQKLIKASGEYRDLVRASARHKTPLKDLL
ncbi:MAG: nickel insertion protein [Candidatus Omnitrophota bacterium]